MISFSTFMPVNCPEKTKVKFNMNVGRNGLRAWDCLLNDKPEWVEMNAYKTKQANNNLNRADYLLAFAQYYPYGPDYYIFGGMYRVEKIVPEIFDAVGYKLTLLSDYEDYRKRLIIRLKAPIGRDIYNKPYLSVQRDFDPEIFELTSSTKLGPFTGYGNVSISHHQLQTIYHFDDPDWKNALSRVKGIYCITNRYNGKMYIGSASGSGEGIWQRWASYAATLSGGNKAFEELKEYDPNQIVEWFTYSILEVFDMKTDENYILQRENYWKEVFDTRHHGMNCN